MTSTTIDFSPLNFVNTCEKITENTYFQNADPVNITDTQYTYTLTGTDEITYCYSTLNSFIGVLLMLSIFAGMIFGLIILINKKRGWFSRKK